METTQEKKRYVLIRYLHLLEELERADKSEMNDLLIQEEELEKEMKELF